MAIRIFLRAYSLSDFLKDRISRLVRWHIIRIDTIVHLLWKESHDLVTELCECHSDIVVLPPAAGMHLLENLFGDHEGCS